MRLIGIAVLVGLASSMARGAWYFSGVSPISYPQGTPVTVKVNALTSHQAVMPFPFYSLKQCQPPAEVFKTERTKENLGELLWGDQIEPSMFHIEMKNNFSCRKLCEVSYTPEDWKKATKLIDQMYRGNLIVDNLPAAQPTHAGPNAPQLIVGYPLGTPAAQSTTKKAVLNNHLHFRIGYHEPNDYDYDDQSVEVYRVVQVFVSARSAVHTASSKCTYTQFVPAPGVVTDQMSTITFSYSVEWVEEPDLVWATRWDLYLRGGEQDARIHWYSIINSLLIVLFLSVLVAIILLRALHRDLILYNAPDTEKEGMDEIGWKLVYGDVFRPPARPALLSALIGSGCQIIGMAIVVLGVACAGFLSPANRGALLSTIILLFAILGSYSGYIAARWCKYFHVQSWKNAFLAGTVLPGFVLVTYTLINFVQWYKHASSAIRWTTLLVLITLWFGVSLPLSLVGSAIGYKQEVIEAPRRSNPIPRIVPRVRWWLEPHVSIPLAGVLPFGAAFIELVFILSSFWQGRVYYVFGFLALVVLIVAVTCAETVIVLIYFQLCDEDHRWWWRSYLLAASAGGWTFAYSMYYLSTALTIRQPSSVMLYTGYMFLASALFANFAGAIGFHSARFFVWRIYASLKVD